MRIQLKFLIYLASYDKPRSDLVYMDLFRGRKDIYARHWEKNGKSGYSPAYQFNWQEFLAFKAKGGRLADFANKKPLVLTL